MTRFIFFILTIMLFFSCRKENSNEFIVDPNNPYNDTTWVHNISATAPVNQIFQIFSTPAQTSSFETTTGGTLHFSDNVEIIFPSNAYPEANAGVINVSLDYLKTRGDVIRFGKSTMSEDELLVSGGAFHIKITQSGSPLQLATGKFIKIRYPIHQYDPLMRVFYGDTTANSREGFTWITASDNTSSVSPVQTDTGYAYEMISTKFEWVNCDRFLTGGDRTKVSVILPLNFTNKNTSVFLVSTSQFLVARCKSDADNRLFYLGNIPIGQQFKIVSLSKIGNDFYIGTKQTTITQDLIVDLSPEKKTQKEIIDYLNSL